MQIIHGTWIPENTTEFINGGHFCIWVETEEKLSKATQDYPHQLKQKQLHDFFIDVFGKNQTACWLDTEKENQHTYFLMPTVNKQPLPSPEILRRCSLEIPDDFAWKPWRVDSLIIENPLSFIKDIHFASLHFPSSINLGHDLLFWHHYSRAFKTIIQKDHYIPALICERNKKAKGKQNGHTFHPTWQLISPQYEQTIKDYSENMPWSCAAGMSKENKKKSQFFVRDTLLRHFSENMLHDLVENSKFTKKIENSVTDTLVQGCLAPIMYDRRYNIKTWNQWSAWKANLTASQQESPFLLGFRIQAGIPEEDDSWHLEFIIESKRDPSLKFSLSEYWETNSENSVYFKDFSDDSARRLLLLQLGTAARIYPKIEMGLNTHQPTGLPLTLEEAFDFLSAQAWVLQDAGFRIIIPAWWTPEGRQRAKIRIKGASSSAPKQEIGQGMFSVFSLTEFSYELAIGDEPVTPEEWEQLVDAKTPLVYFRGQWMQLDADKMQQMLEFWRTHGSEEPELSLLDLMKKKAEEGDTFEFHFDDSLTEMLAQLYDKSHYQEIKEPKGFQGKLRPYQKRGLSWLYYLESLGLNPCLADDMGLGKTIQVIALFLHERQQKKTALPTLLIAPTSVIGNWQREIERFAPKITVIIHHGAEREKSESKFKSQYQNHDVIITSYALARKDTQLLNKFHWQRVILDEAQNIKNPKSAQTRAILKLSAKTRIVLTGTPIENRLLDLWSLFNFLNPGYLGKMATFRKAYEIPIQKDNNFMQSQTLKHLVEPFILRRLKTDKSIIKDLPDKIEQKVYCQLTKEQASLYQAVVREVEEALDTTDEYDEGIKRKGLILSTLMKLKQICNHPAQLLQDGSAFTESRSHKLTRLTEMIEEIMANNESLLIFTQFKEIGSELQKLFTNNYQYNTYFLHGGTQRKRREKMISEFQEPDTEPSIFILSLKAGGVGITLTKANHVFHFDRWWNPAVENQATDRAYRIGQEKTVFAHKYITMGTLEERIDKMLEEKQKLADSIVGADESWLTELDNDSFKQLIQLSQQAVIEE